MPGSAPRSSAPLPLAERVAGHPVAGPLWVGILGLVISLLFIGTPAIWYDEAATVTAVMRSYPELWRMLGSVDAVHGLYYLAMHLLVDLVGYSPTVLRVPSAVAVGLTAASTVVLVRQVLRPGTAVVAGVVFCLLPRTTWMAVEARSYAFTALAAVLLTIVLVRAVQTGRRRWWMLYSALAVLSGFLFLYLALIVVAQGAALAWGAIADRRTGQVPPFRDAVRWLGASALAAVALVPFALDVVGQSGQLHWIDPIDDTTWRQVLQSQWFHMSAEAAIACWPLIVFGGVLLLPRSHSFLRLMVSLLVLPTALLLVATAVYTPLYTPRYLAMCLPFVAVLIGVAVTSLPTRLISGLVIASLMVLAVPTVVAQREPAAKENTDWANIADFIAAQRADDGPDSTTAMIYGPVRRHPSATTRVIMYSYPDAFEGTIDVTLDVPAAVSGQLWETRVPLATRLDRLDRADVAYLVTSIKQDIRAETTATLATIGWVPTDEWNIADVNIVRYERAG